MKEEQDIYDFPFVDIFAGEVWPARKKPTKQRVNTMKANRNAQCPCNSGLKYKKCCINKTTDNAV